MAIQYSVSFLYSKVQTADFACTLPSFACTHASSLLAQLCNMLALKLVCLQVVTIDSPQKFLWLSFANHNKE